MPKFNVVYLKRHEWEVETLTLAWAEVRANEMARLYAPGHFKILSVTQVDPPLPPVEPPKPFEPKPPKPLAKQRRFSAWNPWVPTPKKGT